MYVSTDDVMMTPDTIFFSASSPSPNKSLTAAMRAPPGRNARRNQVQTHTLSLSLSCRWRSCPPLFTHSPLTTLPPLLHVIPNKPDTQDASLPVCPQGEQSVFTANKEASGRERKLQIRENESSQSSFTRSKLCLTHWILHRVALKFWSKSAVTHLFFFFFSSSPLLVSALHLCLVNVILFSPLLSPIMHCGIPCHTIISCDWNRKREVLAVWADVCVCVYNSVCVLYSNSVCVCVFFNWFAEIVIPLCVGVCVYEQQGGVSGLQWFRCFSAQCDFRSNSGWSWETWKQQSAADLPVFWLSTNP